MNKLTNFGDPRQLAWCVYCGSDPTTWDHVPSKVLLDHPYPAKLPVVPACSACNNRFSQDEPYLACLIECAIKGTTEGRHLRAKVRRILHARPAIREGLERAGRHDDDGIWWCPDEDRVQSIVLKLARGHAARELNEPQLERPENIYVRPLTIMTDEERARFEGPLGGSFWPEIGSREFQRLAGKWPEGSSWLVVQPGRYRYVASVDIGIHVKIVMSEYLACEVDWR